MKKLITVSMALCLMFLAGAGGARGATGDSLTVEEAVRLTLASHPLVQQAGYGVAAADARVAASRSPYYPDISLAGLYTLLEPVPKIDFPGLGSFQ
ncbi:MAG: TolC family protein, partial [Candidatus Krumholzibacteria bacterium]|nr:TolC family protein [Candidatus Krumholzibacteria bacterium]